MMRILLILVAFLTACGPLNQGSPTNVALNLATSIVGFGSSDEEEQPLVTEELANADEILFVTLRRQGAVLPMTVAARNDKVVTWIASTGATVALEEGILVATRGLAFDLSGADPIGTKAAINAGGGVSNRTHGFLTALDQIETLQMTCEITRIGLEDVDMPRGTVQLTKFEEDCKGNRLVFKNEYWTDESGNIVRSLQVLSPEIGFLLIERA